MGWTSLDIRNESDKDSEELEAISIKPAGEGRVLMDVREVVELIKWTNKNYPKVVKKAMED